MASIFSHSTFQQANFYGNQQEKYLQSVEETVSETVKSFSESMDRKDDLIALFHQTISFMGKRRNEIAVAHKTNNADCFGILQEEGEFQTFCAFTSLTDRYQKYGSKLIDCFFTHLSSMNHTLQTFQQTSLNIQEAKYLDRSSKLDIQIFEYENLKDWTFQFTKENYLRICKMCSLKPSELSSIADESEIRCLTTQIIHNKEALAILKKESINDYKKLKLTLLIYEIRKNLKIKASDWAVITRRLEVDGKLYALSQYVTTLYRDFSTDPVQRMKKESTVHIQHQDFFLTKPMLEDIAKIFKRAMEWKQDQGMQKLMDDVALLTYEFAHVMPFKRGSAAVGEWLIMSIYRYHGFQLNYDEEIRSLNLEALTSSLSDFVKKFNSLIKPELI